MTNRAPTGLQSAGKSLWKAITTEYLLDDREAHILGLACRQADHLADLEAIVEVEGITVLGSAGQSRLHPAVIECRQGRIALARLIGQLALPAADGRSVTARSEQARAAARIRWGNEPRERDRHGRSKAGS